MALTGVVLLTGWLVVPRVRVVLLTVGVVLLVAAVKALRGAWSWRMLLWLLVSREQTVDWPVVRRIVLLITGALALGLAPPVVWDAVLSLGVSCTLVGMAWHVHANGWPRWRAWPARVLARTPRRRARLEQLRRGWRDVCADAGWSVHRDGQLRYPRLVRAEATGRDQVTVTIRPLAGTPEAAWAGMAHTLRRVLAGQTVRWWIDPRDPGLLVAQVGTRALPREVILQRPPRPAGTGRDAGVWLGPAAGGGDAIWRPAERPHMLIAGETGGGKGGTLRLILAQTAGHDWHVTVLNPKRSGEFAWLTHAPDCEVVSDEAAMTTTVRGLEVERDRRQQVIEAAGADTWHDLPGRPWPPVLLIVDEASEFLARDLDQGGHRARALVALARKGRSAGVHLVVATQRPDVTDGALGQAGGALRDQLAARVAVGSLSPDGLRMVHPGAGPDTGAGLPGVPGRGLVRGLDGRGGSDVYGVQVGYLPADRVASRWTANMDRDASPLRSRGDEGDGQDGQAPDGQPGQTDTVDDVHGGGGGGEVTIQATSPARGVVGRGGPEPRVVPPGGGPVVVLSAAEAAERLGVSPRTVRRRATMDGSGVRQVGYGRFVIDDAA